MSTPIFRWLRRLPAPRSLRKQLLATSLLILSGLLLLIGVLQYILMRDFIYSNRAESMEAQIRSVPREMFFNFFNSYDEDSTGINDTNNEFNSNFPLEREDMNKMPSGLRTGENRRPLLLDAHTTLAMYSSDGTFRDLQQLTLSDIAAPRLTNEQYDALLIHTTDRATGNYKLIQAEDGTEHLAIFMNLYKYGNTRLLLQMSVSTG